MALTVANREICAIGSSCGVPGIAHNDQTGKASLAGLMMRRTGGEGGRKKRRARALSC